VPLTPSETFVFRIWFLVASQSRLLSLLQSQFERLREHAANASESRTSSPTTCLPVKMPREIEISNNERNFIFEALQQGVRVDGRALDQFRNLEIDFADEYGMVTVSLGKTR
jgi:hypothetical protein